MMEEKKMRDYKKYTFALLLATVAALIVCAAAFSFKRAVQATAPGPQAATTDHYTPNLTASQGNAAPPAAAPPAGQGGYRVSLLDGKIAVFQDGQEGPLLVSEAGTAGLPQEDIDLLRQGIPAATLAQVRAILEDFDANVTLNP